MVGVTIILLTCSYRNQEFLRVGYYVNNDYEEEELRLEPPAKPVIDKLWRNILDDKPRVTRFPIDWDSVKIGEGAQIGEAGALGANPEQHPERDDSMS